MIRGRHVWAFVTSTFIAAALLGSSLLHAASSDTSSSADTGPTVSPGAINLLWNGPTLPDSGLRATATVRNSSSASSTVRTVALSAPFQLAADGCSGTAVAAGGTCTIDISWTPAAMGSTVGLFAVDTDTGRATAIVSGSWVDGLPTTCFADPCAVVGGPTAVALAKQIADAQIAACDALPENLTLHLPQQVTAGVGGVADVVVTADADVETTTSVFPTDDPALATLALGLGCQLRARLYNPDFTISPTDDWRENDFRGGRPIQWLWKVAGQHAGEQQLALEIQSTPIVGDTHLSSGGPPPYVVTVTVRGPASTAIGSTTGFFRKIVDYPLISGFGSLVAVAGGVGASRRWLRGRRGTGSPASDPPSTPPAPPPSAPSTPSTDAG